MNVAIGWSERRRGLRRERGVLLSRGVRLVYGRPPAESQ